MSKIKKIDNLFNNEILLTDESQKNRLMNFQQKLKMPPNSSNNVVEVTEELTEE